MASADLIGNFASGVWMNLGMPSFLSALTISGYVTEPSTLGQLNNYIGTCYSGSGFSGAGSYNYDVVPDIGTQELAIIGSLFLISFYNGLAQANLGNGTNGAAGVPYITLREGDTVLTRASGPAIAAVYYSLSTQSIKNLNYQINTYITQTQGSEIPRNVVFPNLIFPTFSQSYWGN